ncbi:hypothetical protein JHV675_19700 [Mycobacterium avium subsp. hominissuis]
MLMRQGEQAVEFLLISSGSAEVKHVGAARGDQQELDSLLPLAHQHLADRGARVDAAYHCPHPANSMPGPGLRQSQLFAGCGQW